MSVLNNRTKWNNNLNKRIQKKLSKGKLHKILIERVISFTATAHLPTSLTTTNAIIKLQVRVQYTTHSQSEHVCPAKAILEYMRRANTEKDYCVETRIKNCVFLPQLPCSVHSTMLPHSELLHHSMHPWGKLYHWINICIFIPPLKIPVNICI